jgi:hypothetical protein
VRSPWRFIYEKSAERQSLATPGSFDFLSA